MKNRYDRVIKSFLNIPVALGLSPRGAEPKQERVEPVLKEYSPGKLFEQLESDFCITKEELEFNSYNAESDLSLAKIHDSIMTFITPEMRRHYPYRNQVRFSCFSISVLNVNHEDPIYTLFIDGVRIVSQRFKWKDVESGEVFHGSLKTNRPTLNLNSTEVYYEEFMSHVLVFQKYVVPKVESIKAEKEKDKRAEQIQRINSALEKVMK